MDPSIRWIPFGLLSALLLAATFVDLREHRIPNLLSLGGVSLGVVMAAFGFGLVPLSSALIGLAVGFALLLPLYAAGAMGAGDVKLMMAVGAFLGGPALTLGAVASTFMAGAVMALVVMVMRDGGGVTARRYVTDLKLGLLGGGWKSFLQPQNGAPTLRFPYAAAILAGALSAIAFRDFWLALFRVN